MDISGSLPSRGRLARNEFRGLTENGAEPESVGAD